MKLLLGILVLLPIFMFSQNIKQADKELMYKRGIDTLSYIPLGLKVGTDAPLFSVKNITGDMVDFKEILTTQNIVLIFYRGKWCPVCNRYLSNLSDSLALIEKKNAKVIVVGPETFENAEKTKNKTNADFILVADTSLQILKAYDVLFNVTKKYQAKVHFILTDIAENNGQSEAQLPVPATYIVEKSTGKIIWRQFDYDYRRRATAKDILKHLP